jgi:membrane associated rhomboid family serine protease
VVPLRDNNPTRIVPVVTYAIIAPNIAVFAVVPSLGASGAMSLALF